MRRHRPSCRRALPLPSGAARRLAPPPQTTAHGALLAHITGGHIPTIDAGPSSFQPMNVNFGLFPPLAEPAVYDGEGRKFGRGSGKSLARKAALSRRALADLDAWIQRHAAGGRGRVVIP